MQKKNDGFITIQTIAKSPFQKCDRNVFVFFNDSTDVGIRKWVFEAMTIYCNDSKQDFVNTV